jgi:tripartite-type tricarboxylate transporter receptor subunit TctC
MRTASLFRAARMASLPAMLAAAFAFAPTGASAQQHYPSQDIHFICAFPPGSGADVIVRYYAEKVRPLTGKSIIVENRSGAGGNIALEYVARSKPDGHTVFVHAVSGVALSMSITKAPPVDVLKQIQVAGTINQQPYMIVVDAKKSSFKTLAELTAAMKAKGEKASYGTSNPSSTITAEIYKDQSGVKAVEVDYRTGADMVNDMASGALDFGSADPVQALAMQAKGDWRILGISSGQRLKATGNLPTMAEQGVKMNVTGWWGAMVPTGTPQPVIDQINKWFVEVGKQEDTRKFLAQFGGDPLTETPAAAQARFVKDVPEWAGYVKLAKIKPMG